MSNCNCCGCIVVDVLYTSMYSGARYTFEAVQDILTAGGTLVDCSAVAHPSIVTTESAWFVDAYQDGDAIIGTATGGSSSFDLAASLVRVDATWSPVPGRETESVYIYDQEHPPTLAEQDVATSVSLFWDVVAESKGLLTQRDAPDGFADSWIIYFDDESPQELETTSWPSLLEPTRSYYMGYGGSGAYYLRTPYFIEAQASVVDGLDYGSPVNPYGGEFKPYLVRAFHDLPEPAGVVSTSTGPRNLPAHPGTPLDEFIQRPMEGLESVVVYAESVALQPLAAGSELAWSVHMPAESSGLSGNVPPNIEGYDARKLLEFGEHSMVVVGNTIYSQYSTPASLDVALACFASGTVEEVPATGFCTAYASRGVMTTAGFSYGGVNTSLPHVTYYRNGVEVLAAVSPTQGQVQQATKADGSYLVVTVPTDDELQPSRRLAGFHKTYSSFIRDTTKPVVGFTVPNDLFFGAASSIFPLCRIVSTKPLSISRQYICRPDEYQNGIFPRPSAAGFMRNSATGSLQVGAPGSYTIQPLSDLTGQAADEGGNRPVSVPAVPWKSHPVPADNHRGAVAQLTDVGMQTCEYWRPRSQGEKVSTATLTFDRDIDPDGVKIDQFTLTKWSPDGTQSNITGLEIEPVEDGRRQWVVSIPTASQSEKSFFVLRYDPAGQVFTDDIVTLELRSISDRPLEGQIKTIYVYPDPDDPEQTKRSYWGRSIGVSTGPIGYHDLEEGDPPVDLSGFPYDPEPCVLAARTSWLMADEAGWPRLIDTSHTTGEFTIGRVASLSDTVTLGKAAFEEPQKKITTVSVSGTVTVPVSIGKYSPKVIREGYIPAVPSLTEPASSHSYFGLSTTIDPCPAASVSQCAAPSIAQRHASAIRCDEDIDGFEIELVAYSGASVADLSKVDYGNVGDFSCVPSGSFTQSPGTDAAALLLAKDGGPISFAKTLQGETLPQNVWMAIESVRGAELPLRPAVSRPPDAVRTSGDFVGEWYRVRYTFENKTYSQEEVLEWEPILAGLNVVRDGVEINPIGEPAEDIELLPGDTYGSSNPPSMVGKFVPWWLYRRPPEVWPDDWSVIRHEDSGIVRQLSGGSVTQTGLQACLSAWREHRTYPALKTTTLGDLVLSLSIRVTLKADVDYVDWQLEPQLFSTSTDWSSLVGYDDDSLITGQFGWNHVSARGTTDGGAFINGASADPGEYDRLPPLGGLAAWQKLEDATEIDTRTVAHQFCADLTDVLVLNKFQEERLAEGEDVMVPAAIGALGYFWRIRKA